MKIHAIYAGLIAVVIAIALIAGRSWADHVRAEAQRDAEIQQKSKEIAASQQDIATLKQQLGEQLAAKDAEIERVRKDAGEARTVLARAYQDAQAEAPHDVTPAEAQSIKNIPNGPKVQAGDLILNPLQQQQAAELKLRCDQCGTSLAEAKAEIKKKDGIIADTNQQLQDALTAAKGGKWYQRTWRALKPLGCAAGAAALASLAKQGPLQTAGAAGGAGIACAVFAK